MKRNITLGIITLSLLLSLLRATAPVVAQTKAGRTITTAMLLRAPQPQSGPDPNSVHIQSISYGGTGCPQGSVGSSLSNDRLSATLIFDSYVASSGPGVPVTEARKNCQINLNLHIPPGMPFTLSAETRGYVNLPVGVSGEQKSTYYSQGSTQQSSFGARFAGPTTREYLARDLQGFAFQNSALDFYMVNINAQVRLMGSSSAVAQITAGSLDVKILPLNVLPSTLTLSGPATVCAGASTTASVEVKSGTPPFTVELMDESDTTVGTQTGDGPLFHFPLSPIVTTTYRAAVTDANQRRLSVEGEPVITVNASGPPTLTLKPGVQMWPPNKKYQTFTLAQMVASAKDGCGNSLSLNNVVIEQVSSDEGTLTDQDIVLAANCQSVQLRADRNGNGDGRVYTVRLRLRDASGNTTRQDFKVSVPHSQNGTPAVDSGAVYTVVGNCP